MLNEITAAGDQGMAPASYIAEIYAALGEKDHAFEWLEKALGDRDEELVFLKVNPRLDPLRSDPRFQRLLERVGLAS